MWSSMRKSPAPQKYKPPVRWCVMRVGSLKMGSIREMEVVSGLPVTTFIEQLERLDDNEFILGFRKLGGDHILKNFGIDERPTVVELFGVGVPDGNTEEEACCLVELIKRDLKSVCSLCTNNSTNVKNGLDT